MGTNYIMKRKLKKRWSTIQPISTKRTTTSHLTPMNTDHDVCLRNSR